MKLNEINLAQDIKTALDTNYIVEFERVASDSGYFDFFDYLPITFSLMSFEDQVIKADDFGFVYVESIKCETMGGHSLDSIKKKYTVKIFVVIVERGGIGLPIQVGITREALINSLVNSAESGKFFGHSLVSFETVEPFPLDFSEQSDDTRYMCCGISAEFNTGFR